MGPVIPFKRSNMTFGLVVIAAAVIAFVATMAFLNWKAGPAVQQPGIQQNEVKILRPDPWPSVPSSPIEVIDGDTVRHAGSTYRLVGFDTPERGDRAQCDYERGQAEAATRRLSKLISSGGADLKRVACACRAGTEGTKNCNYGRLCGSLTVGGRDVGQILIGEGLAHPYVCSGTSCPKRQPWCDG
jgi:endonuclease YncB( thermonuclease family)